MIMELKEISAALQTGSAKKTKELVSQAVEEGFSAQQILNEGLIAGMDVIGSKFRDGTIYIPEVLVSARAMTQSIEILKPLLFADGVKPAGKVCVGTVKGDLHDIGKNLVKLMMESKGLEVLDLGTDVAPEAFIKAAIENDCAVIGLSALLTTTRPVMAEVVKAAEAAGVRDKVKIIIGGAAVGADFKDETGADYYTPDAATAAEIALAIVKGEM